MMYSEFTELTGVEVSASEYAAIEEQYMACVDSKSVFCTKWLKEHNKRMKAERAKFRAEHSIERLFAFMDGVASIGGRLCRYDYTNIDKPAIRKVETEGVRLHWCVGIEYTALIHDIERLQMHNRACNSDIAQYEITCLGKGLFSIERIK